MSENLLATLITLVILIAIVLWVPVLDVICPACSRLLRRHNALARNQSSASLTSRDRR